jgi:hypothetical protein
MDIHRFMSPSKPSNEYRVLRPRPPRDQVSANPDNMRRFRGAWRPLAIPCASASVSGSIQIAAWIADNKDTMVNTVRVRQMTAR